MLKKLISGSAPVKRGQTRMHMFESVHPTVYPKRFWGSGA